MRGPIVHKGLRLIDQHRPVPLARGRREAPAPLQIRDAADENKHAADDPEPRRRIDSGLKESGRDDVLDLRRSRQRIHGEGERAERDRARNEPLRDIALPEHLRRKRVDRKDDDKQRNAAVRQQRRSRDDGKDRALPADDLNERSDDRLRKARKLDRLPKDRAEQEHGKVELQKVRHLRHEEAGEHRRDQTRIGAQHRAEGGERRKENHAGAAIRDDHQEDQRREDDQEAHMVGRQAGCMARSPCSSRLILLVTKLRECAKTRRNVREVRCPHG